MIWVVGFSIIGLVILMVAFAMLLFRSKKTRRKTEGTVMKKKSWIPMSFYFKWYHRFNSYAISRREFRSIMEKVGNLSVYSREEVKIVSVKFYAIANLVFILIVLPSVPVFKDLFSVLMAVLLAVVVRYVLIFNQLDKISFKILIQISDGISALRLAFLRDEDIPKALEEAEVPSLVAGIFSDIYDILVDEDPEDKLEMFYETNSMRLVQTLATVCYILADMGDTRDDSGSNFVNAMEMIRSEIDLEVRRIDLQRKKFGVLAYLPLAPVPCMGILENFLSSMIPEVGTVFKGTIGYVGKIIVILSAIVSYMVITKINAAVTVKENDKSEIARILLRNKTIRKFIKTLEPVRTDKVVKYQKKIYYAISRKTISEIFALKFFTAVLALIVSTVLMISIVTLGKVNIYNNYGDLSMTSNGAVPVKLAEARMKYDPGVMSKASLPSDDTLTKYVKANYKINTVFGVADELDRLKKKYKLYRSAIFQWWFILIIYSITYLGWKSQEITLHYRTKLVKSEAEEDVLQLQTIISILMPTQIDTMDTLYWIAGRSKIYKDILLECYHEYPGDPDMALEKLKAKVHAVPELYKIVDKIEATAYQVSLKEAFADLPSERAHTMAMREVAQETSVISKRNFCSPISLLTLGLVILFYMMLPIGLVGYQEFAKAIASAGIK